MAELCSQTDSKIVYLNVGGKKYATTKQTLIGDSPKPNYFTLMLNGTVPAEKDNKGNYFIDRDG